MQMMQQKNYDGAKKVFQAFLSKYPKSGLGENALYNIGECSFGQRHYEDAIKAFQAVVDKYPKGGKTASALLREGMGWQGIGENTMARIIYTRLVKDYPGTVQARAAQKKLQGL
jgi:tol-pal system protein YbgF